MKTLKRFWQRITQFMKCPKCGHSSGTNYANCKTCEDHAALRQQK